MRRSASTKRFEASEELEPMRGLGLFIIPSVNWEPKGPRMQAIEATRCAPKPSCCRRQPDEPQRGAVLVFCFLFLPSNASADETVSISSLEPTIHGKGRPPALTAAANI